MTITKTSLEWIDLFYKFENMYNHSDSAMSIAEAFGMALKDGLITNEEYDEAREFYGNCWGDANDDKN